MQHCKFKEIQEIAFQNYIQDRNQQQKEAALSSEHLTNMSVAQAFTKALLTTRDAIQLFLTNSCF